MCTQALPRVSIAAKFPRITCVTCYGNLRASGSKGNVNLQSIRRCYTFSNTANSVYTSSELFSLQCLKSVTTKQYLDVDPKTVSSLKSKRTETSLIWKFHPPKISPRPWVCTKLLGFSKLRLWRCTATQLEHVMGLRNSGRNVGFTATTLFVADLDPIATIHYINDNMSNINGRVYSLKSVRQLTRFKAHSHCPIMPISPLLE